MYAEVTILHEYKITAAYGKSSYEVNSVTTCEPKPTNKQ